MFEQILDFLVRNPVLVVALIIALGYAIGRITIKGFGLGSVTGVLFVSLVFGHFGFEGNNLLSAIGFAFFMYVVGFEAGPQIVSVMLRDGYKYLVMALVIAAVGFVTAIIMGRVLDLEPGAAAGVLAGGMTTTPTLAAAQDAVMSGAVEIPEGFTAERVAANITTAYAITYLFGMVGLILIIKLLPKILRVDLAEEAARVERSGGGQGAVAGRRVATRAHRIDESSRMIGMTVREAEASVPGDVRCVKLRRDGAFLDVDDEDVRLQAGDCVTIVGHLSQVRGGHPDLGPELDDSELLDLETEAAMVVVMKRQAVGCTLDELDAATRFGCFISQVNRPGAHVEPTGALTLRRGDVLVVTGPQANLERLGAFAGHLERDIEETDLLTFMIGVGLGVVIGSFAITVAGVSIGLGLAGGVLVAGLVVGYLRSVFPAFGRVPSGARWLIMELGLLTFMGNVGVQAGGTVVETLKTTGVGLFLAGAAVTVLPVIAGLLVGKLVFRMNAALLLGGITGSMTSTASMKVACTEARSPVPALGYTGAFAMANVILAVAGYLIVRFTI